MQNFNQMQAHAYEARIDALWKANTLLIHTLKDIQRGLSQEDPQQRAIFNLIESALERI